MKTLTRISILITTFLLGIHQAVAFCAVLDRQDLVEELQLPKQICFTSISVEAAETEDEFAAVSAQGTPYSLDGAMSRYVGNGVMTPLETRELGYESCALKSLAVLRLYINLDSAGRFSDLDEVSVRVHRLVYPKRCEAQFVDEDISYRVR